MPMLPVSPAKRTFDERPYDGNDCLLISFRQPLAADKPDKPAGDDGHRVRKCSKPNHWTSPPIQLSTLIFPSALAEAPDERLQAAADRLTAETEQRKAVQPEI